MTLKELGDMLPLNYELIRNPWNWVILILMVALAGAAVALILPNTAPQIQE